jgi:hypothetical protein
MDRLVYGRVQWRAGKEHSDSTEGGEYLNKLTAVMPDAQDRHSETLKNKQDR